MCRLYGDVGVAALASALEAGAMPQLQLLCLVGARASDQGIRPLAEVPLQLYAEHPLIHFTASPCVNIPSKACM
eukprot:12030-Eustigmatos_ZCMA.PRE.1